MSELVHCHRGEAIRAGRLEAPLEPHESATGARISGRIPFRSPLRDEVQENICDACWQSWLQTQIKVINELALNLGDPRSHEIIEAHARDFFAFSDVPETTTDFARLGETPPEDSRPQ